MTESERLLQTFAAACLAGGLDLVAPFPARVLAELAVDLPLAPPAMGSARRSRATPDAGVALPGFARPDTLGVLVGNTRALWPIFRQALASDPELARSEHPLDQHVMAVVERAAGAAGPHAVLWGHAMHPRPIPIQRLAAAVGLAALSPSHLSVHARFGPWVALRAVVLFDTVAPGLQVRPVEEPCRSCARPCMTPFYAVLAGRLPRSIVEVGEDWRGWLAVRDACPVGREHRYSDGQVEYHYTKRRKLLACSEAPPALGEGV